MNNYKTDPASNPTTLQKAKAFEWLRAISISDSPDRELAAIAMYELSKIAPLLQSAGETTLALGYKIPGFYESMERYKNRKLLLKD